MIKPNDEAAVPALADERAGFADFARRCQAYLDDAPGSGGHSDAAGSNAYELIQEAIEHVAPLSRPTAATGGGVIVPRHLTVEYTASKGLSRIDGWVTREEGEQIRAGAALALPKAREVGEDEPFRIESDIDGEGFRTNTRLVPVAKSRAEAPAGVVMREVLEKIAGVREYDKDDHAKAARYKPEEGLWTTDEYLADAALASAATRTGER